MKKLSVLFLFIGCVCGAFATPTEASREPVRNVIWVIADGMGPELMGFFMQGARQGMLSGYPERTSALEQLLQDAQQGMYFNYTHDTVVTDSAASATLRVFGRYRTESE